MAHPTEEEKKKTGLDAEGVAEPVATEAPVSEEASPVEGESGEMPESTPSSRDRFHKRLSERYPDRSFDDDESLYSQANDDYDEYENQIGQYKDAENKLTDLFNHDERSAQFLSDWANGGDPVVAFVRRFGKEMVSALDDPEKVDEIAQANQEFLDRMAESRKLEEEYNANLETSLNEIKDLQESDGLSDEDVDKALDYLIVIVRDGLQGIFTADNIRFALSAINHDADVEQANLEGEVRGRNAKIEEEVRRPKRGDGTAALGGSNRMSGSERPQSIFDTARGAV